MVAQALRRGTNHLGRDRLARQTIAFSSSFFNTDDLPVDGPARELVGYSEHPPRVRSENNAKVAVQIAVNYEEGSERSRSATCGSRAGIDIANTFAAQEPSEKWVGLSR